MLNSKPKPSSMTAFVFLILGNISCIFQRKRAMFLPGANRLVLVVNEVLTLGSSLTILKHNITKEQIKNANDTTITKYRKRKILLGSVFCGFVTK